jgi:phosphatidylserine decarboxylase
LLQPSWYKLRSSRKAANISGEVELQFSLIDPVDPAASPDQILAKFYAMAAVSPDADDDEEADALGRSGNADIGVEDDADEDDETVEPTSDETDDTSKPESAEKKLRLARLKRKKKAIAYEFMHGSDVVGIVFLEISRITDLPPERNGKSLLLFFNMPLPRLSWFLTPVLV